MRPILFLVLIANFIYVPTGRPYGFKNSDALLEKSFNFIFSVPDRHVINLTSLTIQTIILLILIGATYTPIFKKILNALGQETNKQVNNYESMSKEIYEYIIGIGVVIAFILIIWFVVYPLVIDYLPSF